MIVFLLIQVTGLHLLYIRPYAMNFLKLYVRAKVNASIAIVIYWSADIQYALYMKLPQNGTVS